MKNITRRIINGVIYAVILVGGIFLFFRFFLVFFFFLPLIPPLILTLSIIWANLPTKSYKKPVIRRIGYSFPIIIVLSIIFGFWLASSGEKAMDMGGAGWFVIIGWLSGWGGILSGILFLLFFRHIRRKSREAIKEEEKSPSEVLGGNQ